MLQTLETSGTVRDALADGCLTDIAVIMNAGLTDRGVDDQIDLMICDGIQNVRTAFVNLVDLGVRNTESSDHVAGVTGRHDLEAGFVEITCQKRCFRTILLINGNKYGSL